MTLHVRDDRDSKPLRRQPLEQDQCVWLALPLRDEDVGVDHIGHRLSGTAATVLCALGAQVTKQPLTVDAGEGVIQGTQPGDGGLGIVVGEDVWNSAPSWPQ